MVTRWDIITIGNLSRNRYWGEREDKAYRPPLCTCTLVQGETGDKQFNLLVDPSLQDVGKMAAALNRRTGLQLGDVDTVFITHAHGDHHYGLAHFEDAQWVAAAPVAGILNASGDYVQRVEIAPELLLGEFEVIHTPGHAQHHYSLRFQWQGQNVVIAADAAVTRDFWADRQGYFNTEDFEAAAATMEMLAPMADIIVPGHDNYFYI